MRNFVFKALAFVGIRTHRSFRLTLRCIALAIGLFAAFRVSVLMEKQEFTTALYFYWGVCGAVVIEFILSDVLADRSFPFDTERKLALMEKRLGSSVIATISQRLRETIGNFSGCDRDRISGTVHIVTELSATAEKRVRTGLLQLTDYVGPDGGKKGRITLLNQGLIGRCARTGEAESVGFANADEYERSMVRDFGFTKGETQLHTKSGRSYLAHPLMVDDTLVAVLYFFTTEPQVFPTAADPKHMKTLTREIVNYLKLAELA